MIALKLDVIEIRSPLTCFGQPSDVLSFSSPLEAG